MRSAPPRPEGGTPRQPEAPPTRDFEVHCHRCRVTFPVGTRRCLHCKQRTERAAVDPAAPPHPLGRLETLDPLGPAAGAEPAEEIEAPGHASGFRIGRGVLWAILILLGSLPRLCGG